MKKTIAGIVAGLGLLVFGAIMLLQPSGSHAPLGGAAAPQGGDFTLESPNGPLSLHDLKGKVVLLYFGYTTCPDICPTSLGFTSLALSQLDAAERAKVQMLFVTVDPKRDSLEKLKAYTAYFHPAILGLRGTPEQIAMVAKRYGVSYAARETGSAAGYVMDHTAYTYVIAPDGRLAATLSHGAAPAQVLEAIRTAMKAGDPGKATN